MLFDEWDDRQSQTQARANAAIAASTSSTSRGMVRNSSMTHTGYSSEEDEKLPPAPRQNRAQTGDHGSDSDGEGPHKPSTTTESHEYGDGEEDAPAMFHVEKLDWRPTREQGALVDLSVASNVLVIATSANYLIRWNLDVDEFDEIQISKRQDDSIHRVAIDPTGSHILVSLESGNNFYIHAKWTKPHQLTKIKGLVIESVAWNNAQGTVDSTKRILLGTTKGLIFECQMDEKQHDKYAKKVYDLNEPDAKETTPISGLYMEQFPSSESDAPKYFVMAATPTRQYQFIGGPTFDAMFLKYQSNPAFLELPGTLGYSELRFFSPNMKQDKTAVAETCAWLSGPGIYYGKLVFGSQDQPGDKVVEDGSLLAYPAYPGSGPSSAVIPPLSLILTRFHFLLLNKNRLVAINQLSEEIVFEDVFNTQQMGTMIRFAHDMRKDTIWLLSDKCVYEVEIISEDREVWKLYLAEGRFADALEYCDTPYQEEQVMNAQADHTFAQGAYELSASIYAKTQRSFEEVTLKFVNIGLTHPEAKSALKTYLSAKLDTLSPQDLTQQTMICTWLTEIYLDNLNHLQDPPIDDDHLYPTDPSIPQLSDEERKEKREQEHREFREFLDHYFDCLNKETTFALISSHGRVDDLLFYARIIGDLEWILNHHCEQHEYDEALEVLATHKDHVKNAEIYYKFTPTLLQHRPKETVDMLIQMKGLDPSKLFPALMRYDASRTVDTTTSADGETSNQAIRYLEHVIKHRNKDPAIHNYLVSLYAKQADDVPLLRFIEAHKSKPIFDYKYALRLCHQEKKLRACVGIYTAMELYEEAVELSLQVDVNVAKRVVAQASTRITPQQRRRLWLIIARHVIETEQHVTKALEILKESELKFEDLLPYFPDFVRIGEFKEEICNSLDSYNRSIEQLKSEMDEYTNSAEMIRKDISELRNRFGIVTSSQRCDLCSQPVLTRPFYLFPCTHVFHIDCMISHVTEYLEKNPQLKAQVLGGVDEKDASSHPTLPASNSHSSIPSSTTLTSSNSQPAPQPSPSTSSSTTSSLLNRMESVLSDKERERERAERERARLLAQEKLVRQQKAMESFASSECLFCGQMMIDSVHNPFIELPAEKEEVASWQI